MRRLVRQPNCPCCGCLHLAHSLPANFPLFAVSLVFYQSDRVAFFFFTSMTEHSAILLNSQPTNNSCLILSHTHNLSLNVCQSFHPIQGKTLTESCGGLKWKEPQRNTTVNRFDSKALNKLPTDSKYTGPMCHSKAFFGPLCHFNAVNFKHVPTCHSWVLTIDDLFSRLQGCSLCGAINNNKCAQAPPQKNVVVFKNSLGWARSDEWLPQLPGTGL